MHSINGIREIAPDYDHFIVDIWGVVHNGLKLYPGTQEVFQELQNAGKQAILLSNSPRRSQEVAQQLSSLGLGASSYHLLHTSGEETFNLLQEHQQKWHRVYPLMSVDRHSTLRQELEELGFKTVDNLYDADLLLNTGPDNLIVELYRDFLREAMDHNVPMLCANPDVAAYVGSERVVCAGALANAFEEMGGEVFYVGKPYPLVYQRVFQHFRDFNPSRAICVGDGVMTDILGAHNVGLASLLIGTGLGAEASLADNFKPTYTLGELSW